MSKLKTSRRWKGIQYPVFKPESERYVPKPPAMAVYAIRSIVNNRIYIGSSPRLGQRFLSHRKDLKANRHHNKQLQSDYKIYGAEYFVFEILQAVFDNEENLLKLEQEWIDRFGKVGSGSIYNAVNAQALLQIEERVRSGYLTNNIGNAQVQRLPRSCSLAQKQKQQFKGYTQELTEPLAKKVTGVKLPQSIHDAIHTLPQKERVTYLRRIITEAVKRDLIDGRSTNDCLK